MKRTAKYSTNVMIIVIFLDIRQLYVSVEKW